MVYVILTGLHGEEQVHKLFDVLALFGLLNYDFSKILSAELEEGLKVFHFSITHENGN